MSKFAVIKETVNQYLVYVEAEDATDAVIKARADEHEDGDLIADDTQNETKWQVFAVVDKDDGLAYPIDETKALPTDAKRILADMGQTEPELSLKAALKEALTQLDSDYADERAGSRFGHLWKAYEEGE